MKKKLLPIHVLIFALGALTLWSTYLWNGADAHAWLLSFRNLTLLAFGGIGVRFLVRTYIRADFTTRHENRVITVFILFLLFDPLLSWWVFFVLGIVTESAQYFFRSQVGPFFNPAALGALILSIFGFLPSWWGINPAPRFTLASIEISIVAWIMCLIAGYVAYRYHKLRIIWSGLLFFCVCYFLLAGDIAFYLALEGTILFFFCVMVCEPKTSPILPREQILYGAFVGLLLSLGIYFHFLEASLIALLLGNIYTRRRFLLNSLNTFFQKPVDAI